MRREMSKPSSQRRTCILPTTASAIPEHSCSSKELRWTIALCDVLTVIDCPDGQQIQIFEEQTCCTRECSGDTLGAREGSCGLEH